LPENEYTNEPGVVLVNRLAELKTKLKEAQDETGAEIEQVEEALLHYAQEHGYTVVVGDKKEAVIDIKEVLSLPVKSDPDRAELDDTARQLGLWDEFSDLSISQLSKALHEHALTEEQREQLEPFAASEKRWTIRLRNRSS